MGVTLEVAALNHRSAAHEIAYQQKVDAEYARMLGSHEGPPSRPCDDHVWREGDPRCHRCGWLKSTVEYLEAVKTATSLGFVLLSDHGGLRISKNVTPFQWQHVQGLDEALEIARKAV